MSPEFWPEPVTRESFEFLSQFASKYDILLIGGWAAWLWTGLHKSKDIDAVVGYGTLYGLKAEYRVDKNERLAKYEIRQEKFDVDLYLPKYSRLAIPAEDLLKDYRAKVRGFDAVTAEALLVLKQEAEINRRNTLKGRKDAIDIATLCLRASVDWEKYAEMLQKYGKESLRKELIRVITFYPDDDLAYLGVDHQKFRKWKKTVTEKLKGI